MADPTSCTCESEEKEKLLESLEEEFKDRYTFAEEEFKQAWERDVLDPPIFIGWDKIDSNTNRRYDRQKGFRGDMSYNQQNYNRYKSEPHYHERRHYYNYRPY